jgi:5-methylcytosine-specific restriction endonuclease McrA
VDCGKKPQQKKERTETVKFRSSAAWQHKVAEILERDLRLCQICIRNLYGTVNQYTYNNLEVHHAVKIEENFEKRLDNDNLLSLCVMHHKQADSGEIPRASILKVISAQEVK